MFAELLFLLPHYIAKKGLTVYVGLGDILTAFPTLAFLLRRRSGLSTLFPCWRDPQRRTPISVIAKHTRRSSDGDVYRTGRLLQIPREIRVH